MKYTYLLILCLLTLLTSCEMADKQSSSSKEMNTSKATSDKDVHSFSTDGQSRTKHLILDLTADFDNHILKGSATHEIERNGDDAFIVDVRDLKIIDITDVNSNKKLKWELGSSKEFLGQPLTIELDPKTAAVKINYETSPESGAIDWLEPIQTADKKHPFLFTQGQAVLTRTWIPLQDSPGIRISYEATVHVPKDLMAVMSAENPQEKTDDGTYHFTMRQPIPPYLIALSIGDMAFRAIGPRTGVYAEHSVVEAAANEFADLEKMLSAAESLYGDYLWDRYDLIVLPPSFPFGGMENPRLTFATPTIIAGDRSLTSLVAHELAHSWSGNLVTNATWNDFWLNEGFTVYFERRIMEALYGKDYTNMLALLGRQDLEATIADIDPKDTHLFLNLEGRDPDDGMTDIAYEKGALLITTIEGLVGREKLDRFLMTYFDRYKFQSMTTDRFLKYVKAELLEPNKVDIDLDAWVFGPGIPPGAASVSSDKFQLVDQAISSFVDEGTPADRLPSKTWTTHEWLHFVRHLPTDLSANQMSQLDDAYGLTNSGNAEILAAWFDLAIRNGYGKTIIQDIENFLVEVGRRKFLTPLYRALKESDQLPTAREIFTKAKLNYHSVSANSIESLLNS